MPDDDQDGAADCDDGLLLATMSGDPAVALTEEGVGASGSDSGLAEHAREVAVAVTGAAPALVLAGRFLHARSESGPGGQVAGGGEPAHVQPDLRDDDGSRGRADPGDLIQS